MKTVDKIINNSVSEQEAIWQIANKRNDRYLSKYLAKWLEDATCVCEFDSWKATVKTHRLIVAAIDHLDAKKRAGGLDRYAKMQFKACKRQFETEYNEALRDERIEIVDEKGIQKAGRKCSFQYRWQELCGRAIDSPLYAR